jgi:hypothetical protein
MHKTKGWWTITFWGLGIQLANSYILYYMNKYMMSAGFKKKQLLSQYQFWSDIEMAWIDPTNYWTRQDGAGQVQKQKRQPGRRLDLQHSTCCE